MVHNQIYHDLIMPMWLRNGEACGAVAKREGTASPVVVELAL